MEEIDVVIQSLQDAKQGKPILQGVTPEDIEPAEKFSVAILEAGIENGQNSLMFLLKYSNGKVRVAQCTAQQFEHLNTIYREAARKFRENKLKKKPKP